MRTKLMIFGIVLACLSVAVGGVILLAVSLGPLPGLAVSLVLAASIVVTYVRLIGPRLGRWGATDDEVARPMPGDDLFPDAPTATRAITIDAQPHDIWPWLVQLGYGRAGWYSYDWIDNDGKRSAGRVVPELQRLEPGDEILMIPGLGFSVRDVEANHFILSTSGDTGTWCIELVPVDDAHTRLLSRWRDSWRARVTPANVFWIAITDPGSWIMEQKMLRGHRVGHTQHGHTSVARGHCHFDGIVLITPNQRESSAKKPTSLPVWETQRR